HQLGRYEKNSAEQIRALTAEAQRRIHDAGLPLAVLPGADVRIQEDLTELVQQGQVLTLGATGSKESKVMSDESLAEGTGSGCATCINGDGTRRALSITTHHSSLITHHFLLMELPHEQVLPLGRLLYR